MNSDVTKSEADLNAMIQKGEILAAFEKCYADDIVMQENNESPCPGKAANRSREQAFVDSIAQVHSIKLVNGAVNGDIAFSEWIFDLTFKGGRRAQLAQAAVRRWKNGKVVHERFYHIKG